MQPCVEHRECTRILRSALCEIKMGLSQRGGGKRKGQQASDAAGTMQVRARQGSLRCAERSLLTKHCNDTTGER